ncbi:MAG: mercury resistance system periplasmic binding protein MerP [Geminicoccaceae bacterium]
MQRSLAACLATLVLTAAPAFAGERTVTLAVENMTCAACPYIVQRTLAAQPGVIRADVSYESKTAVVTFDDAKADLAALTGATAAIGYPSHPVGGTSG